MLNRLTYLAILYQRIEFMSNHEPFLGDRGPVMVPGYPTAITDLS